MLRILMSALVTRSKCIGNNTYYVQYRAKSIAKEIASAHLSVVGQDSGFRGSGSGSRPKFLL
jgi:hypothetical protein